MGALDWMADALRAAGLVVVEYPGWRNRRAPGRFAPCGVLWHHDASAAGPSPGMARLIAEVGNKTTPAPLSQCWVDTSGVWTLCASGRANHAGVGGGWGRMRGGRGNEDAIGIETDHTVGEPWPAVQLASLRRGTRVLLNHLGAATADGLCGHREYAPGRKVDPTGMDMAAERRAVAAVDLATKPPTTEEDDMSVAFIKGNSKTPIPGKNAAYGDVVFMVEWDVSFGLTRKRVVDPNDVAYRVWRALGRPIKELDQELVNAVPDVPKND